MTACNRCGTEFSNHFNGYHWCPTCGKMFQWDINTLGEQKKLDGRYHQLV